MQRIESLAAIGLAALIAVGCAVVLLPFVTAILWAAVLCFATWPLHKRLLACWPQRSNLSAGLMTALIALVMVIPFALVGVTFAESIKHVATWFGQSQGIPEPPAWLARLPFLGDTLTTYWTDISQNAETTRGLLTEGFMKSKDWMLKRSMGIGQGILQLTLSVVIVFFLYRDGEALTARIAATGKRLLGSYSQHLLIEVGSTIKSVVYGVLGTALGQGIIAGIGFSIAGIDSALLLGLVTFFLSLVPFGAPLVWIPAALWLFFNRSVGWGIFMALWGLIGISGIDNVLRPYLISRGTKLPFALVLLGVLGGIMAFGFIGVFLGPTVLAAGYGLAREFGRRDRRQG